MYALSMHRNCNFQLSKSISPPAMHAENHGLGPYFPQDFLCLPVGSHYVTEDLASTHPPRSPHVSRCSFCKGVARNPHFPRKYWESCKKLKHADMQTTFLFWTDINLVIWTAGREVKNATAAARADERRLMWAETVITPPRSVGDTYFIHTSPLRRYRADALSAP